MDTKLIVEGLALLAAGEQIMIRGPVAVDLSDVHEWATDVTVYRGDTGRLLSWRGGHHHVNRITGPLKMIGDALHVPTAEHGVVVVRPIGPQDTWPVFPANLTAWEAFQQGYTWAARRPGARSGVPVFPPRVVSDSRPWGASTPRGRSWPAAHGVLSETFGFVGAYRRRRGSLDGPVSVGSMLR